MHNHVAVPESGDERRCIRCGAPVVSRIHYNNDTEYIADFMTKHAVWFMLLVGIIFVLACMRP
jgi:hypothetical protein